MTTWGVITELQDFWQQRACRCDFGECQKLGRDNCKRVVLRDHFRLLGSVMSAELSEANDMPPTTADLDEMIRFLTHDEKGSIVPIKRIEVLSLYQEIRRLRAQLTVALYQEVADPTPSPEIATLLAGLLAELIPDIDRQEIDQLTNQGGE